MAAVDSAWFKPLENDTASLNDRADYLLHLAKKQLEVTALLDMECIKKDREAGASDGSCSALRRALEYRRGGSRKAVEDAETALKSLKKSSKSLDHDDVYAKCNLAYFLTSSDLSEAMSAGHSRNIDVEDKQYQVDFS